MRTDVPPRRLSSRLVSVDRWHPDQMMVSAILAGRPVRMADLPGPDRCWTVAGLTLAGLTADDIAARLHCSLRLIRTIRADAATILATFVQSETAVFDSELRLARGELLRLEVELARTTAELGRVHARLRRVTAPHNLCPKGLHPMTVYNTYQHGGRLWCRACHRERQAEHRARRKQVLA